MVSLQAPAIPDNTTRRILPQTSTLLVGAPWLCDHTPSRTCQLCLEAVGKGICLAGVVYEDHLETALKKRVHATATRSSRSVEH